MGNLVERGETDMFTKTRSNPVLMPERIIFSIFHGFMSAKGNQKTMGVVSFFSRRNDLKIAQH